MFLGAGAVGYARWVYREVDLSVPGTRYLWPIRAAVLLLVLALLLDPPLPRSATSGLPERWVLLDASLSMIAGNDSESPWTEASARARALRDQGWHVATFGAATEVPDRLEAIRPAQPETRLAPALRLAVEGGAREIRVLSDLRLDDVVAVRAALDRLGAEVIFEALAGPAAGNAGVLRLDVDDRHDAADSGVARVEVHGGTTGDSLLVEVFEEGASVATARVAAPGAGLRSEVEVPLPTATTSGAVRYRAALAGTSDGFALDDGAVAYAAVGESADGGVVLVSLAPDWEPRALLPVLERTTGLAGSGYLRVGPDRYVSMGRAVDRTAPVDSAAVRSAADRAALLVLHGLGEGADDWAGRLASRAPRLVAFASDPSGAALLGIDTSPPRTGEWYLAEEIPASPLAGVLAPLRGLDLPPLHGLLVPQGGAGLVGPVSVRLRGTGPTESPLYLRVGAGGRQALVLARGFWRWAARPPGEEAYETLWSAVAGWLLRETAVSGTEVRPVRRVVPRGERVAWLVPAELEGARVFVEPDVPDGTGAVRTGPTETLLAGAGTLFSDPLEPGPYRYTVLDVEGDTVGAGRFDVASGTDEMLPEPLDPAELEGSVGADSDRPSGGRPLRTTPWPYLLIVGLLCAEWIGRRRSGLR